jgi:amidase
MKSPVRSLSAFDRAKFCASLLILPIAFTGCSTVERREPATPPPHAFIRYWGSKPGDTSLTLGVKDLIDMKGIVTTAGSEYLYKNGKPAAQDADCMRIARQRNVTIVGKTSLSEFAIGVSGQNDFFGTPINPIDEERVPGGSSSGSAVAVARGLCDVAFGTDTAGSIRVPAACCGIFGLKTTFGLVPIKGVYPISPRYLDTIGPMARNIDGLVKCMDLLQDNFVAKYAAAKTAKPDARQIRIGRMYVPGTDPDIDRAIDARLAERGFQVVPVGEAFLKAWQEAQNDGNFVAAAAGWYNNQGMRKADDIGNRARKALLFGDIVFYQKYGDEAKREIAIAKRDGWRNTLKEKFKEVDAIALPVLQKAPLKKASRFTGLFEAKFLKIQNTVAVNYGGVPALAVPIPTPNDEFPVTSLQLIGPAYGEAALLNIGRLVESPGPIVAARQ